MARFFFSGVVVDLPAALAQRAETSYTNAWLKGEYVTVRLLAPVEGVRAHTSGREFKDRIASKPEGAWIAVDDFIESSGDFVRSRALPGPFTNLAWAVAPTHCVLNLGLAAPLYGVAGGGVQAEFVSGPPIEFTQAQGKHWHGKTGAA